MYEMDRREPFWWGLFSLGGVIAALLVPVHIFIHGLAVPLGLVEEQVLTYEPMRVLVGSAFVKVYILGLVALPLCHAAHRVRFTLYELGLRNTGLPLGLLCYGLALTVAFVAAYILFQMV